VLQVTGHKHPDQAAACDPASHTDAQHFRMQRPSARCCAVFEVLCLHASQSEHLISRSNKPRSISPANFNFTHLLQDAARHFTCPTCCALLTAHRLWSSGRTSPQSYEQRCTVPHLPCLACYAQVVEHRPHITEAKLRAVVQRVQEMEDLVRTLSRCSPPHPPSP